MTIDERLDRLTERHEALSRTVEIIAAMHRENEARFAAFAERLTQRHDQLAERHAALAESVELVHRQTETHLVQLMDAMTRLVGVVGNHEHRIPDLEGPDAF